MLRDLIRTEETSPNGSTPAGVSRETPIFWLPLERIQDNPYQPRQHYDAEHVLNLALSIKQLKKELPASRGLQQLPLARLGTLGNDGVFDAAPRLLYGEMLELRRLVGQPGTVAQLMFGHSRLRAWRVLANGLAQFELLINQVDGGLRELGIDIDLMSVPDWQTRFADLMEPDSDYASMPLTLGFALDLDMWRHAITENSQRKNINPIEEAAAMQRAQTEFGLTDEEAGRPFGYARSTAANKMRLLSLPAEVQQDIVVGKLTERHGRELLRLASDPKELAEAHKDAVTRAKTVAQLTGDVNYRAKQLAEKQHERKQTEAAQAALDAGWTPPGSTEPLPADRLQPDPHISYSVSFFDLERSDNKALLEQGVCGSHCECCVLAFNKWGHGTKTMCSPEGVEKFGLACKDHERLRQQFDKLQTAAIELTEAERRAAEERAQKLAKAEELNREGRAKWEAAVAKMDKTTQWQDVYFWQVVGSEIPGWRLEALARNATTIQDLHQRLLDNMYEGVRGYSSDVGEIVPDQGDLERLISALTGSNVK